MNLTDRQIFFLSDFTLQLTAVDGTGRRFPIVPYGIAERINSPASYVLTSPDDFVVKSIDILAGCDDRAFQDNNKHKPVDAFNQNTFVNWGHGCLQITRPGSYDLSAELTNDYVVPAADEPQTKTAVGRLKNSELRITIVE